ncbi:hypothetical protein [Phaeobacter inhibens]|uniref:hypothetical protein n=1 Tax=Phaeobacter inhibens TaxID=221822 RepID=UPI0012EB5E71|nr:hypothetical protein [Phaeobacter inhibens]
MINEFQADIETRVVEAILNDGFISPKDVGEDKIRELWNDRFQYAPLSGAFLLWLIDAPVFDEQATIVSELLSNSSDPGVFASLSNAMSVSKNYCAAVLSKIPQFSKSLIDIFSDRERTPSVRGCAFRLHAILALTDNSSFRQVRSKLFEMDDNECGDFIRRITPIVGALPLHAEMLEARSHLEKFLDWDEATAEAKFQLGLLTLREGLEDRTAIGALKSFNDSKKLFDECLEGDSSKIEAELFSLGINFLLRCHEEGSFPGSDDLENLRELAFRYSAFVGDQNQPMRSFGSSHVEALQWTTFSAKLCLLGQSLTEDIWLEAARVIEEELFFLLCASKTVFSRNESGVIETLITPSILDNLQNSNFQLSATKKWLETSPCEEHDEYWSELYQEISDRLRCGVTRNPLTVSVQALGTDTEQDSESAKTQWTTESVHNRMTEARNSFLSRARSPSIMQVHEKIATYLNSCSDEDDIKKFPHARDTFLYLSNALIEFVDSRLNSPKNSHCSEKYLMKDFSASAKEEHFQEDLYGFLRAMGGTNLTYEPQEIGGGRADIGVISENIQTVVELKKNDLSNDPIKLTEQYAHQACSYQVTQTNFCFLGVLDLSDVGGEVRDLRDCIEIVRVTPNGGQTSYTTLLFSVQGGRLTPSELSKRSKKYLEKISLPK